MYHEVQRLANKNSHIFSEPFNAPKNPSSDKEREREKNGGCKVGHATNTFGGMAKKWEGVKEPQRRKMRGGQKRERFMRRSETSSDQC